MMNLNIRQLEDEIIRLLNASETPMEAKRLVLKEVLGIVEKKADEEIMNEIKESKGEQT